MDFFGKAGVAQGFVTKREAAKTMLRHNYASEIWSPDCSSQHLIMIRKGTKRAGYRLLCRRDTTIHQV